MNKLQNYIKIRGTFPKVYRYNDNKTGLPMYMVDTRSKKWGLSGRKTFTTEDKALDFRETITKQIETFGKQPTLPKESSTKLKEYDQLMERLKPYNETLTHAVDHFIIYLGNEVIRQAKPFISDLADRWLKHKLADTTLSKSMVTELKQYTRFIKWKFGKLKPDDMKKNEIDLLIKGLNVTNNTRKKYLLMIKSFLSWVKDEGYLLINPADGLSYKSDNFDKEFYKSEQITELLKYVTTNCIQLTGYYTLLTFAGIRPSEGSRVEWKDINFLTKQLYVKQGKVMSRHIDLQPVCLEWLQWFKNNNTSDTFIPTKNLYNLEKKVRLNTFKENWIQDGLRHGFATYYKSLIKNISLVSDYMGNSVSMIKKHYSQSIDNEELTRFWNLTPSVVLTPQTTQEKTV